MTDPAAPPAPSPAPVPVPDTDPPGADTPASSPASRRPLPPDPAQYDEPRNVAARARGLDQPYISGGRDPDLAETLRRERRYTRLLVGMVLIIVALGFVLGIVAAIAGGLPA